MSKEPSQEDLFFLVWERRIREIARELEISVQQLYSWRSEFDKKSENAFPGHGKSTPNEEMESLRKEVKTLREEREILKKSLVFFAKESECNTNSSLNSKKCTG